MADDSPSKKGSESDAERTDPFVERVRPDPAQPPQGVFVLEGLLGDSDRSGFRRLYFTRSLTYYAEFRSEDIVFTEAIPPEQPPLPGLDATRIGIKEGSSLEYTRTGTAKPVDEFDLDLRLGRTGAPAPADIEFTDLDTCQCAATDFTCMRRCVPETSPTWCGRPGSTCLEVCEATPFFCRTQRGATCGTCRGNTCQTCRTCQATCRTCETCPGQATCRTCETCGPRLCP